MQTDESVVVKYERNGANLRIVVSKGMTNHELREVLVGLWATLEDDDKVDHIKELTHYQFDAGSFLSPLASSIRDARRNGRVH